MAGAGSGKTFVLTSRLVYLMLCKIDPASIVALTFTEAAAKEVSQRVATKLGRNKQNKALPTICTFHSLGFKIIRDEVNHTPNWRKIGFEKPPKVLSDAKKTWLIGKIKKEFPEAGSLPILETLLESPFTAGRKISSGKKNHGYKIIPDVKQRFCDLLVKENALTFGDMVNLAKELLKKHPVILTHYRRKFSHFLVDEFQDTSPDQFQLLKILASPHRNLFLVGDDDQAIYGFRGADSQNIDKLFRTFSKLNLIKLEKNYRSTRNVLQYANTIFRNKPEKLRKNLTAARDSDHPFFRKNLPVKVRIHRSSLSESRWMAAEMFYLRQKFQLEWNSFAVLYRLNRQAGYYRNALNDMCGSEAVEEIVFSTIHASKGLQFPVVFLTGLERGVFPYHHVSEEFSQERQEEEKRLFYVGVTRAEMALYLTCCRTRMAGGKLRRFRASPLLLKNGPIMTRMKVRAATRLNGMI